MAQQPNTFGANVRRLPAYFSTWVAFIGSAAAAYWLQLTPADQQAVLDAFPALKLVAPAIGFAAFCIARGIPQFPAAAGDDGVQDAQE